MTDGRILARAAIAVSLPLLALAALEAHRLAAPAWLQAGGLWFSAVGMAVAVTGGAIFLQESLVQLRGESRGLIVMAWLAAVVCQGWLVAPWIVAHLPGSPVGAQLDAVGPWAPWAWAIAWIGAADVVAGGVVRAAALQGAQADRAAAAAASGVAELLAQRDEARALVQQLRSQIDQQALAGNHQSSQVVTSGDLPAPARSFPCQRGCGATFASRAAAIGHLAQCPVQKVVSVVVSTSPPTESGDDHQVQGLEERGAEGEIR